MAAADCPNSCSIGDPVIDLAESGAGLVHQPEGDKPMAAAQAIPSRAKQTNNRIDGDVLARVKIIKAGDGCADHTAQQGAFTGAKIANRRNRKSVAEGWEVLEAVLGKAKNLFGATAKAAVDVGEGPVEVGG